MPTTYDQNAPTLTNVTRIGRQAVKFSAIILVVLICGRMFLSAFITYWKATHPEPPPPPTMGFGKLPAIVFPLQDKIDKPNSYRLETATGQLTSFGDRAKVFLCPKRSVSLLADEEVRKIANEYNFVFEPEVLDYKTYRFNRSQPLESSFEINSEEYTFTLETDFLSRPELLTDNVVPDDYDASERVKNFLDDANLLPADVASSSAKITYLKALGNDLEKALSLSDADFIQVDLNRYPVDDKYPMFTDQGYKGTISAIIAGKLKGNDSIVQMDYNYHQIDSFQVETYPLREVQEAWKILQAGEAYVLSAEPIEEAVIREIFLGYYDSFEYQSYLQPVYVFSGDKGFLGYVPALDQLVIAKEN